MRKILTLACLILLILGCASSPPDPNPNAEIIERYTREAQAAIERERLNPPDRCAYEVPDDCDLRAAFSAAPTPPVVKGFWRRFAEAYARQAAAQFMWENSPEGKAHRERMEQLKRLEQIQKHTQWMIYLGEEYPPSQY